MNLQRGSPTEKSPNTSAHDGHFFHVNGFHFFGADQAATPTAIG